MSIPAILQAMLHLVVSVVAGRSALHPVVLLVLERSDVAWGVKDVVTNASTS